MRCTVDCPDRGKCYLEHQAHCCPVFRVNDREFSKRLRSREAHMLETARRQDKRNPIPGAKERVAIMDDEILPPFMKKAKINRLKEIYQ